MAQPVRRFSAAGIKQFEALLDEARSNPTASPVLALVTDNTLAAATAANIASGKLSTKRDAAELLKHALKPLEGPDLLNDVGLWTWLAAFFFESLCPVESGKRTVRSSAHYILDALNHQRRYRHLLATPYQILTEIPDHNRIYLDGPVHVHGEIIEQTMSKLYLVRLPAVREVIDTLYFDKKKNRPKSGLFSKKAYAKPGDLRNRLPARVRQLQMTYDIAALNGKQLLGLLGSEFSSWM
jgi:hypothetical protein